MVVEALDVSSTIDFLSGSEESIRRGHSGQDHEGDGDVELHRRATFIFNYQLPSSISLFNYLYGLEGRNKEVNRSKGEGCRQVKQRVMEVRLVIDWDEGHALEYFLETLVLNNARLPVMFFQCTLKMTKLKLCRIFAIVKRQKSYTTHQRVKDEKKILQLTNEGLRFLMDLEQQGNIDAKLLIGKRLFFRINARRSGIVYIMESASTYQPRSLYVLAIAQIMEENKNGYEILSFMLKEKEKGSKTLQCSRALTEMLTKTSHKKIPVDLLCTEQGSRHWNGSEKYIRRNMEQKIKCIKCNIEVEIIDRSCPLPPPLHLLPLSPPTLPPPASLRFIVVVAAGNMSAYDNVVGGKLKLKGKALDVKAGGMKKKKKHKKILDQISRVTEDELSAGGSIEVSNDHHEEDTGDVNESSGKEKPAHYDDYLTPAERRYIEQREQLDVHRLAKEADKSHRDRIQDFNQYLANMSEHYDIPKVGPG
ncbi:hypothetical protein HS088_TW10G00631 [Tripterygium wilfordii]|uniref:Uncharacterized protein n=1 Tax=Tripterygium wilfordii TaxID=458696 RepID=A0A7J7D5J2_TRIWF|nr:hypothetical protein HS088_TW10G00631 [Tripterygium wilfordii]